MYESEKKTASRTLSGFLQKKKLGVFTWFHTFSLGFTWFHIFSHGFTYFHLVSHIFTHFHMVSHGFTWFHMVSHIFTWFHTFSLISHIFTLVSHVFTYFHMFSRCEKVWKSVRWITSFLFSGFERTKKRPNIFSLTLKMAKTRGFDFFKFFTLFKRKGKQNKNTMSASLGVSTFEKKIKKKTNLN